MRFVSVLLRKQQTPGCSSLNHSTIKGSRLKTRRIVLTPGLEPEGNHKREILINAARKQISLDLPPLARRPHDSAFYTSNRIIHAFSSQTESVLDSFCFSQVTLLILLSGLVPLSISSLFHTRLKCNRIQ